VANFMTTARQALMARLQEDPTLDAAIMSWYTWGSGLIQRYNFEPATCPLLSLVPAALDDDELSNITDRFPQDVELTIVTDGQDAEPTEELLAAALAVVCQARADHLGLAADGLASVEILRPQWSAWESAKDARVRWSVHCTIRFNWYLRDFS